MKTTIIVLGVIFVLVFAPFAVIWGLNTLFPVLSIPYNFYTWLAVWIIFGGSSYKGVK